MKRFLILLLWVVGVGTAQAETLVIGKRHAPLSWDPIDSYNLFWGAIASNMFDGLVLRTETFELVPGLAEKWQMSDDGLHFRFELRRNVLFHNGERFDAEAVKFTFDRLLAEDNGLQRALYDSIKQIKIIDDYTVDFVLKRYDPSFLTKLSGYGGMIVPPDYIKKYGERHFDIYPVGTGPFKFVESKEDDFLLLKANPDYFAGVAKTDSLLFRFIADEEQRVQAFLAGELDILHDVPFAAILRIQNANGMDIVAVPGFNVQTLQFNLDKKIMQDIRVRQALNMAIDKQALINILLKGHGRTVAGLQTEIMFGYAPTLAVYPYDVAQAKKLLQQAGVKAGETININYRVSNHNIYEMARAVGVFLKALDLNVKLVPVIEQLHLRNGFVPTEQSDEIFQFGWNGWTMDYGDSAYLLYHSSQSWNPQIHSAKLDTLLDRQRNLKDKTERERLLQEIAAFLHQQAYYIPLFNEDSIYAVSDNVKNFIPAPDRRMRYFETEIRR
ncbi:hypothetical protein OA57_05480 [Chelonobacter oris]|uniref:Solute-binding protein family 5 domain-containing protein n=1 Tax=Chelonobacter oris TaxID=505317 RepID=A0A0A3AMM9_9PAST|nr:ABC transporter substrate-binding protein [Chelonobacter oris]KGQ70591.1 hypothetical protein OA57_05480 [Chelonobacter oris]